MRPIAVPTLALLLCVGAFLGLQECEGERGDTGGWKVAEGGYILPDDVRGVDLVITDENGVPLDVRGCDITAYDASPGPFPRILPSRVRNAALGKITIWYPKGLKYFDIAIEDAVGKTRVYAFTLHETNVH